VFERVQSDEVSFGVVPLENSYYGAVTETVEQLAKTNVKSLSEVTLQIGHALMGSKLADPQNIARILSHKQALGQCEIYLDRNYPLARREECTSTAEAARISGQDPTALAVCSPLCSQIYGLKTVASDIQDAGIDNRTKFIRISRRSPKS